MANRLWLIMYLILLGLIIIGIDALFFHLLPTESFSSAFLSLIFIVVVASIIVFLIEKLTKAFEK